MDRGRIPEEHEAVLTQNREELLRNIKPSYIMTYLLQNQVIDFDDMDDIEQEEKQQGRRAGVEKLLYRLYYSGPCGLEKILTSLNSAGYKDLVGKLQGSRQISEQKKTYQRNFTM